MDKGQMAAYLHQKGFLGFAIGLQDITVLDKTAQMLRISSCQDSFVSVLLEDIAPEKDDFFCLSLNYKHMVKVFAHICSVEQIKYIPYFFAWNNVI